MGSLGDFSAAGYAPILEATDLNGYDKPFEIRHV
jgi:hypothetical protein